ncbi:MAG: hypothetical protein HYU52_09765, partial [Acidobacteria bacterium]|nr:hypothetical protein [Acidobacteriota bacterium]
MNADDSIRRLRGRLARLLALRKATAWLTAWGFAWGTALLALRFAAPGHERTAIIAGVLGAIAATVAAAASTRRAVPADAAILAMIDRDSSAGGLLMASAETNASAWSDTTFAPARHAIRWRAGRPVTLLCVAGIFAWSTLLIPSRFVRPRPALDLSADKERIEEQIETLKNEEILPVEAANVLEQQVEEIAKSAEGDDPAKAWEAMDNLEQSVQATADAAAEEALQTTDAMTKLEAFAGALAEASDSLSPEELASGMQELSDAAKQAAAEHEQFAKGLSPELAKAAASGSLSKEQMEKLAEAAGLTKEQLRKTLEAMNKAGLADQKTLRKNASLGNKADQKELAKQLRENPGRGMSKTVDGFCKVGKDGTETGKGGVTRGTGHAPLLFDGQTPDDANKFKEIVLPPSALGDLAQSIPIATSPGTPDDPNAPAGSGGVIGNAAAGGGSAARQPV